MSNVEKTVGLIQDVLLPLDSDARYDLYFTNKRIAIVCMGPSYRAENERTYSTLTFIAPTTVSVDRQNQYRITRKMVDEEMGKFSLDEKLRISKKSCYYDYDEIEEVKLVLGKKPKFVILSEDCESKFAPTEEQLKQLSSLLPTIDGLKDKLVESGSWEVMHQTAETSILTCGFCGFKNDQDAVFCQNCGKKIEKNAPEPPMLVCTICETKNRAPATFCKNCGMPIQANSEDAS